MATSKQPKWLRELVNEHDVDPKSLVAATALEIALSPRAGKQARRPRRPRAAVDPARLPPFDKDLQCKHCGKAFRRVCNYREHQRVHSNEYKFACSVQGCDRKFMWRSSIQAHLRSHQAKLDRRRRPAAAHRAAPTHRAPAAHRAHPRDPHVSRPFVLPKLAPPPLSPVSPVPQGFAYLPPPPAYKARYVSVQNSR